jgi:hypothetical protein
MSQEEELTLDVDGREFVVVLNTSGSAYWGEVRHVARNGGGFGVVQTPIGQFFGRPLKGQDGLRPHERIDCVVRKGHRLSPDPAELGRRLATALEEAGIARQPLWISWHVAGEVGGEARGELDEQ